MHGATMVIRHGKCVAAHFGSAASEAAVCLQTVGIADRSDRTTFELRRAPHDLDEALAAVACQRVKLWSARENAIVRCEATDSSTCAASLLDLGGTLVADVSDRYAAIGVIGPLAADLLASAQRNDRESKPIVLRDGMTSFELLVSAETGPAVWAQLLVVGAQFRVACVGLDALEHLAASHRVGRPA